MIHHQFFNPLEKALRFYAVLALAILSFQCLGVLMYVVNVWPTVSSTVSGTTTFVAAAAVGLGLFRSLVWVSIYWKGAAAFSVVRNEGDSATVGERLTPILSRLTRLLVISCILDVCFLPAYFLSETLLPFSVSGWRLGLVELGRIIFPQSFGIASLILAFLTHQYGQLIRDRSQMKQELELTI